MNIAAQQNDVQRLLFVYQQVNEALYGSVYPLRVNAAEATGTIALGQWKAPFLVSKQFGQHEIIYGSLVHHMHEAARPIIRMGSLQEKLRETLPPDMRASMIEYRSDNQITYASPQNEFPALFLYQQEELIKDTLLLSASHMRTLLELLSGKRNRAVPTYDYEGNPTGSVTIHKLFHALSHHRYCVVSAGFVCDIFSQEDTPGLPDLFGMKVKLGELLRESIGFLEGITVNDFVGILRARLTGLAVDSKPKDIIFAHQNVYSLSELVRCRVTDVKFLPFQNYLFSQFTADEKREIEQANGISPVNLKRQFTLPRFHIGSNLNSKSVSMVLTINGKQESFQFRQEEFFEKLSATWGEEPLIPIERLRQNIDTLAANDY